MSIGMILLIVLILALVGVIPTWGHSSNWGYGPSGGIGLVLLIVPYRTPRPAKHSYTHAARSTVAARRSSKS
jgi:hypothetical protein